MKRFLLALFVFLALPALADDMIASNGRDSVRLTQEPCPPQILAILRPDLREQVKEAIAEVDGTTYRACWAVLSEGVVGLAYEDGDEGVIPLRDSRRSPSI